MAEIHCSERLESIFHKSVYSVFEATSAVGAAAALVQASGVPTVPPTNARAAKQAEICPRSLTRCYGFDDLAEGSIAGVDTTLFDCGSIAEMLAAMCIMLMHQDGTLDVEADANKYLPPECQINNIFTETLKIKYLLSHTSGLTCDPKEAEGVPLSPSRAASPDPAGWDGAAAGVSGGLESEPSMLPGDYPPGMPYARWLKYQTVVQAAPPGEYQRDDVNYWFLGAIIETVSGQTYCEYVQDRVFEPLGIDYDPGRQCTAYQVDKHGIRHELVMRIADLCVTGGLMLTADEANGLLRPLAIPLRPPPPPSTAAGKDGKLRRKQSTDYEAPSVPMTGVSDEGAMFRPETLKLMYSTVSKISQGRGGVGVVAGGLLRLPISSNGATGLVHWMRPQPQTPGADAMLVVLPESELAIWCACNTTCDASACWEISRGVMDAIKPVDADLSAVPRWLVTVPPAPRDPTLRLFCMPHAGASAPVLFASWTERMYDWVEVIAVQLPGRGARQDEKPMRRTSRMAREIALAVRSQLVPSTPFVLYGHGLGALLAYEVARWLQGVYHLVPRALLVSGSAAPPCFAFPEGGGKRYTPWADAMPADAPARSSEVLALYDLKEKELTKALKTHVRTPPNLAASAAAMRSLLGALAADVEAEETYQWNAPAEPHEARAASTGGPDAVASIAQRSMLSCPTQAFHGSQGDHVRKEMVERWAEVTSGPFTMTPINCGHYPDAEPGAMAGLVELIKESIAARLTLRSSWLVGTGGRPTRRRAPDAGNA